VKFLPGRYFDSGIVVLASLSIMRGDFMRLEHTVYLPLMPWHFGVGAVDDD
jgi:hypothetical protein